MNTPNKPQFSHLAFRRPLVSPGQRVRETSHASFGDLVRMMAEGIANAQMSLDRASAELVAELAETRVPVIPSITENIDAEGNVSYSHGEPNEVSLLELGVRPTFYQFSEATVEVAMDLKIVESETETGSGDKRMSLFADTASVRFERKLDREVNVSSRLSAKLVPVPMPLQMEPARSTQAAEETEE